MLKRKKKLLKIYLFLGITLFFVIFLLINNIKIFLKASEVNLEYQQIKMKIEEEKRRKKEIEKKIDYLNSDDGRERILIEKNNLKKPGEKVIKILDY